MDALDILRSWGVNSWLYFSWFACIFLTPYYYIGPMLVPIGMLWSRSKPAITPNLSFSVVVAGNNEEHQLRRFVESIAEQTICAEEGRIELVVVDDGSTDRTAEIAWELQREGKIDKVLKLDQRGGKAAALNLAHTVCTGDIIISADVDTTFDRDAFARILAYFADPRVGAVSCIVSPLNDDTNLITRYQVIEYAFFAYLRRCISSALNMMPMLVGAFYACRRTALQQVGALEPGAVEDVDLALKLRQAGWRVLLAPEARALTIVPDTIAGLIVQRLRWDQGVISLWTRKSVSTINPRNANFSILNALVLLEHLSHEVILGIIIGQLIFVLYITSAEFWQIYVGTIVIIESFLIFIVFIAAAVEGQVPFRYVVYVPYYIVQTYILRIIRSVSVIWELIFFSSLKNPVLPARVRSQVEVS